MAHAPTGSSLSPAHRPKKYGVLSEEAVKEIFAQRPARNADGTFKPSSEVSHRLAGIHGVSERSIREIWNRKSWTQLTRPMWSEEEVAASVAADAANTAGLPKMRGVGRPKGSKDSGKKQTDEPDSPVRHESEFPADPPAPSLPVEMTEAEKIEAFDDPFTGDWQGELRRLDLSTMMSFAELAPTLPCDEAWLMTTQELGNIVSSRRSAIEEISGPEADCDVFALLEGHHVHEVHFGQTVVQL